MAGRYAYVADGAAGPQVIDVNNPFGPARVGASATSGFAVAVTLAGNYAYVANESAGLQIIDVSDPANPHRVSGYSSFGSATAVAVSGNYAYVADYDGGLQIILTGPVLSISPSLPRQKSFGISLQGLPGLRMDIEWSADLRNWQTWTNGTIGTSPLGFQDTELNSQRFYRAFVQ